MGSSEDQAIGFPLSQPMELDLPAHRSPSPARRSPARRSPAHHSPERHSPARHSPERHSPERHSPARHSAAHHSLAHHSLGVSLADASLDASLAGASLAGTSRAFDAMLDTFERVHFHAENINIMRAEVCEGVQRMLSDCAEHEAATLKDLLARLQLDAQSHADELRGAPHNASLFRQYESKPRVDANSPVCSIMFLEDGVLYCRADFHSRRFLARAIITIYDDKFADAPYEHPIR